MIQAVLLSGLLIGVLSALPIVSLANSCCCLWIVGGGALAAYLEQQKEGGGSLPVARGAGLGLMAGVVGAFVWLLVSIPLSFVMGRLQQRMAEAMLQGATDMPPGVRDMFEGMAANAGSVLQYVIGFLFHLCAGLIFATAGGALGAAFFKRDVPPAAGGQATPPPLPPQL